MHHRNGDFSHCRAKYDRARALGFPAGGPGRQHRLRVLSSSDYNVLLDPRCKSEYRATMESRIPFNTMLTTSS